MAAGCGVICILSAAQEVDLDRHWLQYCCSSCTDLPGGDLPDLPEPAQGPADHAS